MRADSLIESVKLGLWLKTGCERVLALLHIAHCLEPSFRKTPGDVAQLGERSIRIAEVDGSIPFISTNNINLLRRPSCRRDPGRSRRWRRRCARGRSPRRPLSRARGRWPRAPALRHHGVRKARSGSIGAAVLHGLAFDGAARTAHELAGLWR